MNTNNVTLLCTVVVFVLANELESTSSSQVLTVPNPSTEDSAPHALACRSSIGAMLES